MQSAVASTAVVVLAGGEASRFPGKLEHRTAGKQTMIEDVFERARETGWPVYIAGKSSFSNEVDARLAAPLLIDRHPGRGPLRALLDAAAVVRCEHLFAIAADLPAVDGALMRRIAAARQPGDEAVVPRHAGGIEPLAALYGRRALLRASLDLRAREALRDAVAHLATRFIPLDARYFHNVNRIEDLP
jgi:molybdopterin-guanine dinucleotide biosynthesis protein A